MHSVGLLWVLCHVATAVAFGIFDVDAEVEGRGLLLRCFESRGEFFGCCGRVRIFSGGIMAPPEGCFPDLDGAFNGTRLGRPRPKASRRQLKGPFGVYGRRLVRCCGEPLRLHRRLIAARSGADGLFPNWTVFKPDPSAYIMSDPGMLELPGFSMHHVGAASMSETFPSIRDAILWEARRRDQQFKRNRELYAVGSAWGTKATLWDGEDFFPIFEALRSQGTPMSFTVVDIGAAGGLDAQSPLINLHFQYKDRIKGIAFEGDPELCKEHRSALPELDLRCGFLSVKSLRVGLSLAQPWAAACSGSATPRCVDVWKVDIDGIDCTAVELLLQNSDVSLWPKALVLEVNPHFPPPIRFSVTDISPTEGTSAEENMERLRRGLYGCSLSHMVSFLGRFDYWLVGFAHKDAVFLHKDLAPLLGFSAPLDEFFAFAMSVVMTYASVPPGLLREWFYARPHESLATVDKYLTAARQGLSQQVAVSLSL